MVLGPLL